MDVGIFFSILFGIIEGLTEFAPISSTAHLLLLGKFLRLTPTPFFETFTIFIQTGAILAGLIYFRKTLLEHKLLIPKILIAFIPSAIIGLLFHKSIIAFFSHTALIGILLIVGGIIFLFLRPIETHMELHELSYKQAFLIGCAQVFAFIPGVSRSGATLIGGTALGIARKQIVPFSFLLGIVTIVGASTVALFQTESTFSPFQIRYLAVGTLVSALVAYTTIGFFIRLLTEKPLSWFGWYRIILGIIVLLFLL